MLAEHHSDIHFVDNIIGSRGVRSWDIKNDGYQHLCGLERWQVRISHICLGILGAQGFGPCTYAARLLFNSIGQPVYTYSSTCAPRTKGSLSCVRNGNEAVNRFYLQPSAFRRPSSLLPVCRLQKAFVSKMSL